MPFLPDDRTHSLTSLQQQILDAVDTNSLNETRLFYPPFGNLDGLGASDLARIIHERHGQQYTTVDICRACDQLIDYGLLEHPPGRMIDGRRAATASCAYRLTSNGQRYMLLHYQIERTDVTLVAVDDAIPVTAS